jgi:hypothetical protein
MREYGNKPWGEVYRMMTVIPEGSRESKATIETEA